VCFLRILEGKHHITKSFILSFMEVPINVINGDMKDMFRNAILLYHNQVYAH
jgi:hypothetical protein